MLVLTHGQTDEMIVTLNENKTLPDGYFLFVFTHSTTREIVNKIYAFDDDTSGYPERFNAFSIDTATVFLGKSTGDWDYRVYQQESAVNTIVTGLEELERGKMKLKPAVAFTHKQYEEPTTFKQYGG